MNNSNSELNDNQARVGNREGKSICFAVSTSAEAERCAIVGEMSHNERLRRILIGQLAFLRAIRADRVRIAATDDICDELSLHFSDWGMWRGEIPQGLAAEGVIKKLGWQVSSRVGRHLGPVAIWKAIVTDHELDKLCELISTTIENLSNSRKS
ncbi:MAG: hypothetical protein C0467_30700 [Planctomycetaceae bacterium]|nr:hypothetical protein [Planctomycetaceae bacterium]